MFTYYTIIGKSPAMIDAHLDNVCNYAGFNKIPEDDRELLVIVFRNDKTNKTDEIVEVVHKWGGRVEFYDEPHDNFLLNLYACWNLGYEKAQDGWVFRGGSDQIYSEDSMYKLYVASDVIHDDIILQANTIENINRSPESRHILADLGDDFDTLNMNKFEAMCEDIQSKTDKQFNTINDSLKAWGKPEILNTSMGQIMRTDGCSWLMKRSDWVRFGPLPPLERGITGDVVIHDRMQQAGFRMMIFNDMVTYHFVRGESVNV